MNEDKQFAENAGGWGAGTYVLLVDKYMRDGVDHVKGDVLHFDEGNARRLGLVGSIAPIGSIRAQVAQGRLTGRVSQSDDPGQIEKEIARIERTRGDEEGTLAALRERLRELRAARDDGRS